MDMLHYQFEADTGTEYFGISLRGIKIKIIFTFIIESLNSFIHNFWKTIEV